MQIWSVQSGRREASIIDVQSISLSMFDGAITTATQSSKTTFEQYFALVFGLYLYFNVPVDMIT